MYEPLRDLDPELLLPGCERHSARQRRRPRERPAVHRGVHGRAEPRDEPRAAWREYPSDERSTSFQVLLGAGRARPARRAADAAAPPVDAASILGSHFMSGTDGNLVLLIRGELLNRYPGTTIYLTRSTQPGAAGSERVYPLFRGRLGPDMTFVGFGVTAAQMRAERWFVVLEQQPTEPRFGLDESTVTGRRLADLGSWNNLAWGDLAATDAELAALTHVRLTGRLARSPYRPAAMGVQRWPHGCDHCFSARSGSLSVSRIWSRSRRREEDMAHLASEIAQARTQRDAAAREVARLEQLVGTRRQRVTDLLAQVQAAPE